MIIRSNIKLFEDILLKVSMWFPKGLHCTSLPISCDKEIEKVVDYGAVFRALLTELCKTFDYITHDLIFAKLEA